MHPREDGVAPSPMDCTIPTACRWAPKLENSPARTVSADYWGRAKSVIKRMYQTAVCTLVPCSVPDIDRTAAETRRILKPTALLVFLENRVDANPPRSLQYLLTITHSNYRFSQCLLASGARSMRRNSCALSATTTVDNDMRIAPTDIGMTNPMGARTPAARGTEIKL